MENSTWITLASWLDVDTRFHNLRNKPPLTCSSLARCLFASVHDIYMRQIDMNLCDIPTQKISSNNSSNMLVHGNGSVHALKGKFIVKLKNCNWSSTLVLHRFTWLWLFHASMQQHVPSSKDNRYGPVLRPLKLHFKIPHFFHQKKTTFQLEAGQVCFSQSEKPEEQVGQWLGFCRTKNPPPHFVGDVA